MTEALNVCWRTALVLETQTDLSEAEEEADAAHEAQHLAGVALQDAGTGAAGLMGGRAFLDRRKELLEHRRTGPPNRPTARSYPPTGSTHRGAGTVEVNGGEATAVQRFLHVLLGRLGLVPADLQQLVLDIKQHPERVSPSPWKQHP